MVRAARRAAVARPRLVLARFRPENSLPGERGVDSEALRRKHAMFGFHDETFKLWDLLCRQCLAAFT